MPYADAVARANVATLKLWGEPIELSSDQLDAPVRVTAVRSTLTRESEGFGAGMETDRTVFLVPASALGGVPGSYPVLTTDPDGERNDWTVDRPPTLSDGMWRFEAVRR